MQGLSTIASGANIYVGGNVETSGTGNDVGFSMMAVGDLSINGNASVDGRANFLLANLPQTNTLTLATRR